MRLPPIPLPNPCRFSGGRVGETISRATPEFVVVNGLGMEGNEWISGARVGARVHNPSDLPLLPALSPLPSPPSLP